MKDLSKYIGRSYNVYNCFDLVKEFYKDQLGLELQNYFEGETIPARQDIECLIKTNLGIFVKVDKPKFGDLVVIRLYGYASHIGVCVGEGKFIHSIRTAGSCMDSLAKYSKITEGFFRHEERS
jgi:cell wall-associated NlpC family hydrolase